jgi:hypothetical protein
MENNNKQQILFTLIQNGLEIIYKQTCNFVIVSCIYQTSMHIKL